jgi:hypothetical protein
MQSIDEPLAVVRTQHPVANQPALGILGIQTDETSRLVGPHNDRPSVHTTNPDALAAWRLHRFRGEILIIHAPIVTDHRSQVHPCTTNRRKRLPASQSAVILHRSAQQVHAANVTASTMSSMRRALGLHVGA